MSHDDSTSDPELGLALVHRNTLARSLLLRARFRARTLDLARSLRTLSQLGSGLARRPAADDAGIPRLLAEAARRVRERAARDNSQEG